MSEPVAVQPKVDDLAHDVDGPKSKPFVFNVAMSCGGCKGAIDRVLSKIEDIEFNVDLEGQKATVTPLSDCKLTFQDINDKIAKTGKEITDRYIGDQPVNEKGEPIGAA